MPFSSKNLLFNEKLTSAVTRCYLSSFLDPNSPEMYSGKTQLPILIGLCSNDCNPEA